MNVRMHNTCINATFHTFTPHTHPPNEKYITGQNWGCQTDETPYSNRFVDDEKLVYNRLVFRKYKNNRRIPSLLERTMAVTLEHIFVLSNNVLKPSTVEWCLIDPFA